MKGTLQKLAVVLGLLMAAAGAVALAPAQAEFPYGNGSDYSLPPGTTPNDLAGDDNDWKFAATPEAFTPYASDPKELFGVRGAHVADPNPTVDTAWHSTVGRPDVTIAVLDSGIRWDDSGAMQELRRKVRLSKGELPAPNHSGAALEPGVNCSAYGQGSDANDQNGDGVFNVLDYLCDSRASTNPPRAVGPGNVLDPQDLIITFEDGADDDGNGFVDDIAGWDFLDDDNDAYDDVHYDHGTGEAKDSSAEADNGGVTGSCPNCMFIPTRVGDSFVADANNFGQAVIYSVDNGVLVVQEALGTLNNTQLARQAVEYAYDHGVAVIASAADEAAQHHNWPSNYPHTIVMNSVEKYDQVLTPNPSYLQFNGCTNFSTHVTLAVPSDSCSSNATGVGAGMAGLVYSAALNARDHGTLNPHPECELVNGDPCILSVNEVRQLMATGTIDGTLQADDVNFAPQPEPSCTPVPAPGCTDPNRLSALVAANRPSPSPLATTRSYPARKDFDEFYGYGRLNMAKAVAAVEDAAVPPEAEITGPDWYSQVDPARATVDVEGEVGARGNDYTCRVYVAPGSEPNNALTTDTPPGDFEQVSSSWCDGGVHSGSFEGTLGTIDLAHLKSRFPADAGSFNGREPPPGPPNFNGRPNTEPYGFTVRVVVSSDQGGLALTGQDRRNLYLHRDQDMLPGFPKVLPSDGASSPRLADLDADNRNELIFGTSDGIVHAMRPDGTELPGWPVHGDPVPLHTGGEGFTSGAVDEHASRSAMLASVAVGDLERDGSHEVVAADMNGRLYVWDALGNLVFKREANVEFSGKPLQPHANVRRGHRYRTQHGFLASPVLADLDGNGGRPEIVAAGMDRHVYAWDSSGATVPGFPVLLVDRSKISAIDPQTHAPTFLSGIGAELDQGAIVDTPAVGDITGDGKPEIVVGTNEEYPVNPDDDDPTDDGGFNAGNVNTASLGVLGQTGQLDFGNSRLYAIPPTGDPGGPSLANPALSGWPVKIGLVFTELLPVVGEGMTGSPVIGPVDCTSGGSGPKVGAIPGAGPGYILNPDGNSCYGESSGHDNALQTDFAVGTGKYDTPAFPAVGHATFGDLGGLGPSFLAPTAGVIRALDLGLNEYQGGQDFVAAWDSATGQFRPGFPTPVNDLQFITGPSVADIDGLPGEEVLAGTASLELAAFNAAGVPASTAWPKLTSDWTVANPLIGSFGTQETDGDARKVVIGMTRAGTVLAYSTAAPACSPSSWSRFHHDNANSGDYRRDATLPGKPYELAVAGTSLNFRAPGDDLLCGTASSYQVVQSDDPITGANFSSAETIAGAPAPAAAGTAQTVTLPANPKRFVAIRAVDEQGNVGPPAVVEAGPPGYPRPKSATPVYLPLAIAFKPCAASTHTHAPPLAFGSCRPAQPESAELTVGTADSNAKPTEFSGFVRLVVQVGDPATPANEAEVRVTMSLSDVRRKNDLSDYTGEVQARPVVRITDRSNGPSGSERATVVDTNFAMTAQCGPTAGTVGANCDLSTTWNALMPGVVTEGKRAIWQLGPMDVWDGGPDGDADTGPNTLFARQGVFAP